MRFDLRRSEKEIGILSVIEAETRVLGMWEMMPILMLIFLN